jgi:hypothetical protein
MNRTVRVTNWHYNSELNYNPEEAILTPDFMIEVEDLASKERHSFNPYSQIKSQLPPKKYLTKILVRNIMHYLCAKPFTMYSCSRSVAH